jgi:hypothetical protein
MDLNKKMQDCISECLTCYGVCLSTIQHCLRKGGNHASPEHIRLLMDCAYICLTSANFMLLGSNYHNRTCELCAEICTACADDCETMMEDDDIMRMCAEACRKCAVTCREMASMSV